MQRQRLGLVGALLGFLLVALAGWFGGSQSLRPSPDCPPLRKAATPAPPQVYLTNAEIGIGAPLCLALDRSRFFAREREALAAATTEVDRAREALAAAGTAQGSSTAAAAQERLTRATAALDALPRERKLFITFDGARVPMAGHGAAIQGPAGENQWALERIELRGSEDASSDDGKAWREILGGPKEGGTRLVRVGVAVSEGDERPPVARAVIGQRATLRVYHPILIIIGGLGLVLLAAGIGLRGWNTGLLRDGGANSQFSLARVQMAWWLVLSIGGFLFIWMVSGQWRFVMTAGTITLLGISATTGVAARLADDAAAGRKKSTGFWADIINDGTDPALHRIQLVAWTVVLGAIFAWTVIWRFAFPDFDTNLLLLAGIAGGTYLGFKFKE